MTWRKERRGNYRVMFMKWNNMKEKGNFSDSVLSAYCV